jgi:AbrB family looped-hinge helix DNA binding protein
MDSEHLPQILGTATLNSKGQLVIPAEARTELGLKTGSKLVIMKGRKKPALILIRAEDVEAIVKHLTNAIDSDS